MPPDRSRAGRARDEALAAYRASRQGPAFNSISVVSQDDLDAGAIGRVLTLAAGAGIEITTNATTGVATFTNTGGGGGGSVTTGTATLDFGAWPGSAEASIAVTGQASITGTSQVSVWLNSSSTSGTHTASDHRYAAALIGFSISPVDVGVGFTIYARCLDAMQGTFSVSWRWS